MIYLISFVKSNFFTEQVWRMIVSKYGNISISGPAKWMDVNLTLFELDDYDNPNTVDVSRMIDYTRSIKGDFVPCGYYSHIFEIFICTVI